MSFSSLVQLAPWYTTDGRTIRSHRASTLAGVIAGIAASPVGQDNEFVMLTAWSGPVAANDDGRGHYRHRLTFDLQATPACATGREHHWIACSPIADGWRQERCRDCNVIRETETNRLTLRTHTTVRYVDAEVEVECAARILSRGPSQPCGSKADRQHATSA